MIYNFEEYNKKEKELKEYQKRMLYVVDDYIKFNSEFRKKHRIDDDFYRTFDFYHDSRHDTYVIRYHNPDLYKSIKNYNL